MKKILVAYYSHSGNTSKLAKMIGALTGADVLALVPEKAYPQAYQAVVEQAKQEIHAGHLPPLKGKMPNLAHYDCVLVGTPNWWSTMAPPVASFLKACDLSGKTAAIFATHGGGGFGHIERDFKALAGGADKKSGFCAYGSSFKEGDVRKWLENIQVL